jgi:hypothetical protein
MHCRQPNPGPIAIIGHVRLKSHRLNPGIPQLAGQPIQLESRACEDSHVTSLRSLTREKTILRILCAPTFSHSLGQKLKSSMGSAVGTVIADRPPPKSVQAEFPHTAPTLGA